VGSPTNLTALLARLAASGVDFVLVGGLAAVAQGASFSTQDVDVVHRVLGLRALVELKRDAAAPEDRQTLAVLEATLRRLTRP